MEGQSKREQIIEAAIRLFTDKGFEAASVQDIACEAGVAKGTVYIYFPSKDELVKQVYRYCYMMDVKACNVGLDKEKNALDKLCRRLDNIVEFVMEHPLEAQIEVLYANSPVYGPKSQQCLTELYEDIDAVIREGIEAGELKNLPSSLLSHIYYGITTSIYSMVWECPERWKDAGFRDQCHQIIRDSLTGGK